MQNSEEMYGEDGEDDAALRHDAHVKWMDLSDTELDQWRDRAVAQYRFVHL